MTASTVFTPAALSILHAQALEEDAARKLSPPSPRQRYIALLADLAGLLEDCPGLPEPYVNSDAALHFCCGDAEGLAAAIRALKGHWDKRPVETETGGYFECAGRWRGYPVSLTAPRASVCTKVVTGTEMRPVEEVVTPAVTVTVMKPVETYEWRCCESVLAPAAAETAAA